MRTNEDIARARRAHPVQAPDWRAALRRVVLPPRAVPELSLREIREDALRLFELLLAKYGDRVEPLTRKWLAAEYDALGDATVKLAAALRIMYGLCDMLLKETERPMPPDVQRWALRLHRQLLRYDVRRGTGPVRLER